MRGLYLLLAVMSFGLSQTSLAQMYDLELKNTNVPSTVVMGQMVPVTGDIKNNGPDAFETDDGWLTMNVHASYTPLLDTFSVEQDTSFKIQLTKLEADSTISYSGQFFADIQNFRAGHSGIIVVVWPRLRAGEDTDVKNHYYVTQVTSIDSNNAVNTAIEEDLVASIELYPNPAVDNVSVTLEDKATGTLSLISLSGQVIEEIAVTPHQLSYDFSLEELQIVSGMYLVSFEGEEGSWTKKLTINRNH